MTEDHLKLSSVPLMLHQFKNRSLFSNLTEKNVNKILS